MTTFQQSSLLHWVNLYINIKSLDQLKEPATLTSFIQTLFNNTELFLLNNDISILLDEINSTIPVSSTILPRIDTSAYLNGDQEQILTVLSILQSQYQAYTIVHTLSHNKELSFTSHIPQFIPNTLQDIKSVIFSWSTYILSDYVNASLILPLVDFTLPSWKSGIHLSAILHYHNPQTVPDLLTTQLSAVLQIVSETYHIPALFDPLLLDDSQDESVILNYLIELIPFLFNPTKDKIIQRHKDIDRFKNNTTISTTFTSTFSLQQLNITKTTKYKDNNKDDLDHVESTASILVEKLNNLHHRLISNIPTRLSSSSLNNSVDLSSFTDDSTTVSTSRYYENNSVASGSSNDSMHMVQLRVLHPLQATEEDYAVYDRNFKLLQSEFQTLTDGDIYLFQNEIKCLDISNHQQLVVTKDQLFQLHQTISDEFERSELELSHFRRGFAFGRMCSSIRQELEAVQNQMLKSITTHYDIQALESSMERTSQLVETVQSNFSDLIDDTTKEDNTLYLSKFQSISNKNKLVMNWVDEVRVWFTEAERIEQWIKIRIEKLNDTILPDPLQLELSVTYDQVQAYNSTYARLEKEIDAFNEEDMARLRSHVKTLTGSGRADKDLSPADTTTIEITLTTLSSLDKLMHLLRKKSYDLQLLTQRVSWEQEHQNSQTWLSETKTDLSEFLNSKARWTPPTTATVISASKREQLLEKEKEKEAIIQQLLSFEKSVSEFDQNQFTKTVNHFEYLDSTSRLELPQHLKSRQVSCEQTLEDLMKRLVFTRQVVEQRLNVMDFLHQTEMVIEETEILKKDLSDLETHVCSPEEDREITTRIQLMHEKIAQLVNSTAHRIPYPVHALEIDRESNLAANEHVREIITDKCNQLIVINEDLNMSLFNFRDILKIYQFGKEYLETGIQLCDWADDRLLGIQKAKINIYDIGSFSVQDLELRERDLKMILDRLKNGKENEVVELLTCIQSLLESGDRLNVVALDRDGLLEISLNLEEKFDRLQHVLKQHELDLEALRKKMEDGNSYLENNRELQSFIDKTRHSIPGLKQTCGFITGQSEQQDRYRLDMFKHSLDHISTDYATHQLQFQDICSNFILIEHSKIENIQEIRIIQQALENNWSVLEKEIVDLKGFFVTVEEWYDRQRRLSMVEKDLLGHINQDIISLAKSGWDDTDLFKLQQKINEASIHLKDIGLEIDASSADTAEDPLQTANYSRARDRHNYLMNKVQAASNNLNTLRCNANKAVAYSTFLSDTDKLLDQVQDQTDAILRRLSAVGSSKFSSQSLQSIDVIFKSSQNANSRSEKDYLMLAKQLKNLFIAGKELESEAHNSTTSSLNLIKHIKESLNQLSNTIGLEKKQIMFIRKVQIHAKAATDLQTWIQHCSKAISELTTTKDADTSLNDILNELDSLEQKMNEMKPTVKAFQEMELRIFFTKDGQALDLYEMNLDQPEIKEAIETRRSSLLGLWNDLERQYQEAILDLDNSKRTEEISQKLKFILTKLYDMNDRVDAIRIFRNSIISSNNDCDLTTVRTCPLTAIPTEHRLASAKAELNILERDLETNLQPMVQTIHDKLNAMIPENITKSLSAQRTETDSVLKKLVDFIQTKRKAILEAEKMADFLIVMEELEVLLLALAEVVSRADPSNARVMDGVYNRSDLQILLIDLDTRYHYYNPKISELIDEFKQVANTLMEDERVVKAVTQSSDKWTQLKSEAASRKSKLIALIASLNDTTSMGFDKGSAIDIPPIPQQETKPCTLVKRKSIPRYMGNTATRTKKTSVDSSQTTTSKLPSLVKKSSLRQLKSPTFRASTKTPENYVSDPQNVLDVALGDILNDSPYKIQVKMVPGEVGKYWFGITNPKLAYCRILRSRMVMVRVGGGWVELSQFLSDHALLEGGNFVPGRSKLPTASNTTTTTGSGGGGILREGFLNATTVGKNNSRISVRSPPLMTESRSYRTSSTGGTTFGHGIKTGNKFLVTLDSEGNRVEVKMTKATNNNTKFSTPRRMNV